MTLPKIPQVDYLVLQAIARPFGATVGLAVLVLLIDQMLRLMDAIVVDGSPIWLVRRMLIFLLPEYFGLALPIAFLIGVLFGFRELSASNAIDSLYAAGASLKQFAAPVVAASIPLTIVAIVVVGYLQPYGEYKVAELNFIVKNGAAGLPVKAGEIAQLDEQTTFLARKVDKQRQTYSRVFISRCRAPGGECTAIAAQHAAMRPPRRDGRAVLRLYEGQRLDFGDSKLPIGVTNFEYLDYLVEFPGGARFRQRGASAKEMLLNELFDDTYRNGRAALDATEQQAYFHWVVLQCLVILAIPYLAIALGIRPKRSGGVVQLIAALMALIIYIEVLEAGKNNVIAGGSVWFTMWLPFFVFLAVSVFLFRVAGRPGGLHSFRFPMSALTRIRWTRIKILLR